MPRHYFPACIIEIRRIQHSTLIASAVNQAVGIISLLHLRSLSNFNPLPTAGICCYIAVYITTRYVSSPAKQIRWFYRAYLLCLPACVIVITFKTVITAGLQQTIQRVIIPRNCVTTGIYFIDDINNIPCYQYLYSSF